MTDALGAYKVVSDGETAQEALGNVHDAIAC